MASVIRRYDNSTVLHSSSPTILFTGTVTITRSNEKTKSVTISVKGNVSFKYSGSSYASPYSSPKTGIGFTANSTDYAEARSHGNYYNIYNGMEINSSWSQDWAGGSLVIYSNCGFGNKSSTRVFCDKGHSHVEMATIQISELPYNPYSAPSTYAVSVSPSRGRLNYTNFTASYEINGGTGTIDWVNLKVFPGNVSWNYGIYSSSLNNKQIYDSNVSGNTGWAGASGKPTFKLDDNQTDGTNYKVAIHFSDSHNQYISGDDRQIEIYTKPRVSVSGSNLFSPQDEPTFSWSAQTPKLNNETMNTFAKLNGKDISISGSSLKITNSKLNEYFTAASRSVSRMAGTFEVTNENVSAKSGNDRYLTTATHNFNVQYQPVNAPTNPTIADGISGKTIIIQDTPYTNVSWAYPSTTGAAGVVNGYIIRVYSDSNCTKKVGSDKNVSVATAGIGGSISLNNKTDLKRGVLNYATITPYYTKPDDTGIIEGTKNTKVTLVKPLSRINTPVISYPTNNAQWHNKYFRILLQLPADDDLDVIKEDYDLKADTDYKYADVELTITADNKTYVYSINDTTTKNAFSVLDMYHKRKLAINPSYLSNFTNTSNYKIELRVKKKYYDLPDNLSWSKKAVINITNVAVNRQTFTVGQTYITAAQYSYVRNASVRLNKAYPFKVLDNRNVAQNKNDQIDTSEYAGIYQTILDIQNGVNTYCDYTNTNVKLNQDITDLTTNPPKVETITANDTDTTKGGRNYKNILVDDMNKLY